MCSLVGAAVSVAIAMGGDSKAPVIRVGGLSPVSQADWEFVRVACRIGGLIPELRSFRRYDEMADGWQRGELEAIIGIPRERAMELGGRWLPPTMIIPTSSPHARSLEMGLSSLLRTGYAARRGKNADAHLRVGQVKVQKDLLILSLIALAGAGLVLAQRRFEPRGQLARANRSILAPGRC